MNKNEVGILISQKVENEITKKDIARVLTAFIEVVKETLLKGDNITLEGFMTLSTMVVNKRQGTCFEKDWSTPKKHIPTISYSKVFKKIIASKEI